MLKTMVRLSATDFDADPYLLNTPACAYNLKTMETVPDRESRNLTQVTTCNLNTLAKPCKRWYSFIDQIMSHDKEKAAFLQRALGYSLLGINREECMFIAYGSQTRNGKEPYSAPFSPRSALSIWAALTRCSYVRQRTAKH